MQLGTESLSFGMVPPVTRNELVTGMANDVAKVINPYNIKKKRRNEGTCVLHFHITKIIIFTFTKSF